MREHIISISASLLAAVIVMILHELPKTIIYYMVDKNTSKKGLKHAWNITQYIDPIGVILAVTTFGGFSKPYTYRIKDKKTNFAIGITGFSSLILMFGAGFSMLKFYFGINSTLSYNSTASLVSTFLLYLCLYVTFISFGMFVVNLFPIATFDMANVIAGKSPVKFFGLLRKDYFFKLILLVVLMFNVVASFAQTVLCLMLG